MHVRVAHTFERIPRRPRRSIARAAEVRWATLLLRCDVAKSFVASYTVAPTRAAGRNSNVVSQRQINIRLRDEDVAVLEAAAFLHGGALPDFVRRILLERVAALRSDPRVQQALRLRAEQTAEEKGVLRPINGAQKQNVSE